MIPDLFAALEEPNVAPGDPDCLNRAYLLDPAIPAYRRIVWALLRQLTEAERSVVCKRASVPYTKHEGQPHWTYLGMEALSRIEVAALAVVEKA